MDTIGPWELLIIVAILVALFGASRLPKMARGLGEGIREFKKGISEAGDPADNQPSEPAGQESSEDEQSSQPDRHPRMPRR
ncbi:MAG TPA: twin-arginine translocase TatA/TatE family subunit [Actinomycetes bacterium]